MHRTPEILVIDPSIIRPEFEAFKLISRLSSVPVSFHLPALEGMDTLLEAERYAHCVGVIILGSAASVFEEREWQKDLTLWIANKIQAKTPSLGICFGHQLLAYMHGSSVVHCGKKHLGFRDVEVFEDSRLKLSAQKIPMFVAHNDIVQAIPEDFELFASSDVIAIDGLRHKTLPIWTLQAHIEANEIFALNCHYTETCLDFSFGNLLLKKFLDYVLTVNVRAM